VASSGHRYYSKEKIDTFLRKQDILKLAKKWVFANTGYEPAEIFYCQNSYLFQGRLSKLESDLSKIPKWKNNFPIISSAVGEIGNNSFDHNLGNWRDISGIFFAYDIENGKIVLADRGRGILKTLQAVKPELSSDDEALKLAFTEIISGRAPENRGNGLKFVRKAVAGNPISLLFQSGDAVLKMKKNKPKLDIKKSNKKLNGCLALIKF
jgi:hypothetical protein